MSSSKWSIFRNKLSSFLILKGEELRRAFRPFLYRISSLRAESDSLRRQVEFANEKVKKQEEMTARAEVIVFNMPCALL